MVQELINAILETIPQSNEVTYHFSQRQKLRNTLDNLHGIRKELQSHWCLNPNLNLTQVCKLRFFKMTTDDFNNIRDLVGQTETKLKMKDLRAVIINFVTSS